MTGDHIVKSTAAGEDSRAEIPGISSDAGNASKC